MLGKMQGRAIVGLDLDGVVCDYVSGFRSFLNEVHGFRMEDMPDPLTYNLARAGWPIDTGSRYLSLHAEAVEWGLYRKLPAIDGAVDAIRELSERGAHVRIVSHRLFIGGHHGQVVCDTAAWLEKLKLPYMSLCFTGLKDSVAAHVYVEDSVEAVGLLRGQGIKTFVFDQPYNQEIQGDRICSWPDGADMIVSYLESIGQIRSSS